MIEFVHYAYFKVSDNMPNAYLQIVKNPHFLVEMAHIWHKMHNLLHSGSVLMKEEETYIQKTPRSHPSAGNGVFWDPITHLFLMMQERKSTEHYTLSCPTVKCRRSIWYPFISSRLLELYCPHGIHHSNKDIQQGDICAGLVPMLQVLCT